MNVTIRGRAGARGQGLILLAFLLVALLMIAALVVDLGIYFQGKARLQNVVDTAALAAAQELPDHTAAAEAVWEVLRENGYLPGQNGVIEGESIPNPDGQSPARYYVSLQQDIPSYFSRILNFQGTTMKASGMGVLLINGIVPWMFYIPDIDYFEEGQRYSLKDGPLGAETGNFNPLRLTGPGADLYREDVIHGFREWIEVGKSMVQPQPGNVSGPTVTGVRQRIANGDYYVVVPATSEPVPLGASQDVLIEELAGFYLHDARPAPGGECIVEATFVDYKSIPWAQGGLRTCLIR